MLSSTTQIGVLLDRSGSMAGRSADVIGGFNSFLKGQQEAPGVARMTVAQFDHEYQVIAAARELGEVAPLTTSTYQPRGMTALLDALGRLVNSLDQDHAKTIVVVFTDGYENASKEWTKGKVKREVERLKAKGWEFVFNGADIDAFGEGAGMGFSAGSTVKYDGIHTKAAFQAVNSAVSSYRFTGALGGTMDAYYTNAVNAGGGAR